MLYTIGYGSRAREELVRILKRHKIELLVDIRRWPTSKLEEYRRENISKFLKKEGIEYVWLGEKLGGFRKGGYKDYTKSQEFKEGIDVLMSLSSSKRACIMCVEVSHKACHRRFVSNHLVKKGIKVAHIISEDELIYEGEDHSSTNSSTW